MIKKHKVYGLTLMLLSLGATSGYAAEITWQTSVIMADETDVSTNGQVRLAINAVNGTVTVNGVEFTQVTSPGLAGLAPSLNGGFEKVATNITGTANVFNSGDTSAPLSSMLPGAFWGGTQPVATTFSNLVPGQEYEIQVFCNARDSRNDQFVTMFDNGLDPLDVNYVAIAGTAKLNNFDRTVDPVVGVGQGDYIIGTFTADATTQIFRQLGSTDGGASGNSGGRVHINAIQLRAIGTLQPIPEPAEAKWTGLADANLDNTTANFALNAPDESLLQGTLADAVESGADVIFTDDYTSDPGGTVAVSTSTLSIPNAAMPTAPLFTFRNSNLTPYVLTSADIDGITGGATNVSTQDPDSGVEGNGGTLTLYGTHSFGGNLTADFDTAINIGDSVTAASLTNANLISNGTINWDTTTGDAAFTGNIAGAGVFAKLGSGTLTVSGSSDSFSGSTSITQGTLLATGSYAGSNVDIASGATFEVDRGLQTNSISLVGSYTGEGVLRLNNSLASTGTLQVRGTMALGSDALIDIVAGTLWRGSGAFAANWAANESNMTIAGGAAFLGVEASIRINALNGDGDISTGWATGGYPTQGFTIGVADGSGSFNGGIADTDAAQNHIGRIRKVGTGTQTFGGALSYTGNTIVQNGTFELADGGSQTFYLGVGDALIGDGGTNRITGATPEGAATPETGTGDVVIDGKFIFDETNAAGPLAEGDFWVIVDSSELASVTYGDNFSAEMPTFVLVETAPGSGLWESEALYDPLPDVPWTFNESTGILSVGTPVLSDVVLWANSFLPADVSDMAADFDGDGQSNEDEYLFGLDPTDPSSSNPITVPLDAAAGTLTFTRRDPTLTGQLSSVETSTDLELWMKDNGAILTPGAAVDGVQSVAVQLSAGLLTGSKLFVRIMQGEVVLFSTDFESDNGGFAAFGSPNDWAYGTPDVDNGATPPDQLILSTGNNGSTFCWGTDLTGAIEEDASSFLRGPDAAGAGIDLTSVAGAELTFAAALDTDSGDSIQVLVKQVGTDAVLETITAGDLGISPPQTTDWSSYGPFDISAAAGNNVYLEFQYVGTSGFYIGLYVDDISVREKP